MNNGLNVIILAAGQGKRMYSSLPKVLHLLAGKPLLHHVLETAQSLNPEKIYVVYGHGGDQVISASSDYNVEWVHQVEQNGTGHAVDLALANIPDSAQVLILYGDVPLLSDSTLHAFIDATGQLGILTAELQDASGYGRIIRDYHGVIGIVEQGDASDEQLLISEINTGIMYANVGLLKSLLDKVDNNNNQGEIYLTDVVALAHDSRISINSLTTDHEHEISGVNNKIQLASMERYKQLELANEIMEQGTCLLDPSRIDIRGDLQCGKDVTIDVNCIFEGDVKLADGVAIGPNVVIKDSSIGANTEIKSNCVIESAMVAQDVIIGPFARLRPGANLAEEVHIGNFVEVKNSNVGVGSKVNHLSYIGDSDIGSAVNIGAGTITCNYDGANKHRTIIGDNVFIGSGTELVAPIVIGKGATTGAGSTLSKDAPEDQLTLTRSKQRSITNWQRPVKSKG